MISSSVITFINIFTIVNLTILSALFWFRKNNVKSNRLFALIILIPAFNFLSNLLMYHNLVYDYYIFTLLDVGGFLWGPFVLWYVMLLLGTGEKLRKIHILHLLPFFIVTVAKLIVFFNEDSRNDFFDTLIATKGMKPQIYFISNFVLLLQILVYLSVSLYKVLKYQRLQSSIFSNENAVKTKWLFELIIFLFSLDFTMLFIYTFLAIDSLTIDLVIAPIADNVFYGLIVYKVFFHAAVFTTETYKKYVEEVQPMIIYEQDNTEVKSTLAYKTLDKNKYRQYASSIEDYFKTEKPYLDPNLTITKLSESVNIPTHYITATLSQQMNTTFLDYVNFYRVELVKAKLLDKQHLKYSIESIGYDSGFNSRATFFRVFKKFTQQTPLEFVKNTTI